MTKMRVFFLGTLLALFGAGVAAATESFNFNSPMDGAQEAPISRDTPARGNAVYKLNADGTALQYRLIVANIENVFMAHIHRGVAAESGPVVVWLYPSTTPNQPGPLGAGRVDGVIASGTITAA